MGAIANVLGNMAKPLFLGLLMLVGLGLLSDGSHTGNGGAGGFECRGFTNDPELNRTLCRYHPARLWNTPIGELVPWLSPLSGAREAQ